MKHLNVPIDTKGIGQFNALKLGRQFRQAGVRTAVRRVDVQPQIIAEGFVLAHLRQGQHGVKRAGRSGTCPTTNKHNQPQTMETA